MAHQLDEMTQYELEQWLNDCDLESARIEEEMGVFDPTADINEVIDIDAILQEAEEQVKVGVKRAREEHEEVQDAADEPEPKKAKNGNVTNTYSRLTTANKPFNINNILIDTLQMSSELKQFNLVLLPSRYCTLYIPPKNLEILQIFKFSFIKINFRTSSRTKHNAVNNQPPCTGPITLLCRPLID